ncbi:MAG: rod shape-determining protein MreD [Cereibacter changlensis]|jgi:rod shape-determining protein MreD|uniref:Rod shape-determining protein MreD n=2 Tax=Cereibacter changlensis TaxID=402884 RepID=A0A2T4JZF4_9RHOB|nr:rod shape-determining protein MreD [Cereibacter changlensis]MBZ4688866.1 hypothetical protein [Cereibacter sp.]PTE23288.1 rod shape-determining protein MreD [Cereibacter changlensis JA139]PZX55130.1 rod shape-determining protein MreD [Cereibacter changlensis]TKA97969.1 rod shape-determining protein MreD [Cereibacter changlensis]
MADRVRGLAWAYPMAFVGIAVMLLIARLMPISAEAGSWPGPDLLLCLILVWVTRRPDYLPALLIALVVLAEDLILMRPPGLWAALVLVASEFLRSRGALTRELSFAGEWLLVAGVMVAMLLAYRLMFLIAFLPQPGFGFAMIQTVATILCYPLVVGLSWFLLDLHKPATGELDSYGRRM